MPNRRAPGMVVTSLALPADLLARVRARAEADGVSSSAVIRAALERFLRK